MSLKLYTQKVDELVAEKVAICISSVDPMWTRNTFQEE
jgi:hypothetical protein